MCEKRYFLLILLCASIGAVGCRQLNPFAASPASADLSSDSEEIQRIELPIPKTVSGKAAPYARSIKTKPAPAAKPPAAVVAAKSAPAAKSQPAAEPDLKVTPATKRLDIGSPPPIVIADANSVPQPQATPTPQSTLAESKAWLTLSDMKDNLPKERSLAEQFASENQIDATETEAVSVASQTAAATESPESTSEVTKLPPIDEENSSAEPLSSAIAESPVDEGAEEPVRRTSAIQIQGETQKEAVIGFAEEQQSEAVLQQPKSFQGPTSAEPQPTEDAAIEFQQPESQPAESVRVVIDPAIQRVYEDLQGNDPSNQVRACRYLQQHGSPKHIERLTPLLKSKSLEVSLAAATALGSCGPWPHPKPLEDFLLNGNLPRQAAAAISLCQLGSPIGPAAIEQMSSNLNPEIRAAAASAAGILADPLFASMLIRMLDDPTVARQAALSALPRCVGEQVAESGDSASVAADKWRKWYQSGGVSVTESNAN